MPVARRGFYARRLIPAAVGLAALVAICFSVPPVAEAVVGFFSSLRGTPLETDSRTNIIESGFAAYAPAGSQLTATSDGHRLSLQSYYLDAGEIGFDFILSGPELDPVWSKPALGNVSLPNLVLQITDALGERQVWHSETDFGCEVVVRRLGEGKYDCAVFLHSFRSPVDTTGKEMVLSFDDIRFFAPLAEEDEAPVLENSIAGPWAFDILIDERFAQVETVTYRAVDPVAASKHGIAVESVEIRPYTSRIELTIDYAKNDLADEANAREVGAPWFKHKLDFFHTEISVEAGGKTYDFRSIDILWEEGDVVRCWCELDSMYFGRTTADATLQITSPSMNGEVISIPLVRD